MKPIVHIPHTVLTQKAADVDRFDKKLWKILAEMKETLIATTRPRGVGLAAPQIGVSARIFIARTSTKTPIRIFINPTILKSSGDQSKPEPNDSGKLEGCLSIPKIWGAVNRDPQVTIQYQDSLGKSFTEKVEGFLATIIQHEVDHLNGILFTQRVLEQKGKLYQTVKDKEGKETLEELEIK